MCRAPDISVDRFVGGRRTVRVLNPRPRRFLAVSSSPGCFHLPLPVCLPCKVEVTVVPAGKIMSFESGLRVQSLRGLWEVLESFGCRAMDFTLFLISEVDDKAL